MNNNIIFLFCVVDDFCKLFYPSWEEHLIQQQLKKRRKPCSLHPSEIITIYIHFQQMQFRNFKIFYTYIQTYHRDLFPKLVSYQRFIELIQSIFVPLCVFMQSLSGKKTGLYFIDSTPIKVCHIKREKQNQVFQHLAQKSKSSTGWFFGFKLHLVINHIGEIIAFKLTNANVDDRNPVEHLTQLLQGLLVADKGYLSQNLYATLFQHNLRLITKFRKNMKNKFISEQDKILLKKRALIESVYDQLKNIFQIEHTRHRSIINFMANLIAGLIAYSLKPKKPSIEFENEAGSFKINTLY